MDFHKLGKCVYAQTKDVAMIQIFFFMDLVFCVGDSYHWRHFNLSENYSIILVTLEDISPQAAFTEAAQPLTAH